MKKGGEKNLFLCDLWKEVLSSKLWMIGPLWTVTCCRWTKIIVTRHLMWSKCKTARITIVHQLYCQKVFQYRVLVVSNLSTTQDKRVNIHIRCHQLHQQTWCSRLVVIFTDRQTTQLSYCLLGSLGMTFQWTRKWYFKKPPPPYEAWKYFSRKITLVIWTTWPNSPICTDGFICLTWGFHTSKKPRRRTDAWMNSKAKKLVYEWTRYKKF